MSSKTVVIKYSKNGDTFELLVDSELAYEYVTGKRADPLQVLEIEEVYKDAKKAERQSEDKIMKTFGTMDMSKIAEVILKNSNVPMPAEARARLVEEKRRQIINLIAQNSIDPRTNAPNPPLRIENAVNSSKVNIDPFKPAAEQVDAVVEKIRAVIPIKFATSKIQVIIPADSASRCYGIIKRFGLKSEEWLSDGSLKAVVEFPAGMQGDFFNEINRATQGRSDIKVL